VCWHYLGLEQVAVLAVTVAALAVATLTAVRPGWRAARTPIATVLRAE
jgi:ABC-type lipoprotein release transport system permease subunit